MRKKMMLPLFYFLISMWLMAGSPFAEPLDNFTAEFILNVTDTIGFDGSRNKGGESRTLIAQNPPEQKVVNVPNVGGMNWREAKALLESLGLRVAPNEVQGASMGCDPSNAGKAVSTSAADMWAGGVFGTVRVGTQVTLNYCPDRTEDRCGQIDAALAAASQAKDINRFRALVEQARVENCNFYQNAYNHLRNWEQQLQRSATQPPPRPPVQPQPPHTQPQPSPQQVSPIQRAWQGSWILVSKHTGGKFKGSSVRSQLTVSFQNNQVEVAFGKYTASVKSITPERLVYEGTFGGNRITITLHRVGRGIKGNFQGVHVASGQPVMGEFHSDPPP